MALKQANRLLNLNTPLGEDELLLTHFEGHEGLSQLFHFKLEMISDNNSVAATDLLGKNVTFSVQLADESPRNFNGIVSRFLAGDEDENGRRSYRAQIVPWLWFLTRNSDCRIFQEMTAPEIIEQIFKDRGFTDYKLKLSGSHAKREYCVQHQETDFNFVSRLMEEEGIFYYFEHADGSHTMILGDKASAYFDCDQKEVDYPFDFGSIALEDHIRSWEHRYEFRTGKVAQTDYNFETPSTDLKTDSSTIVDTPGADKFEHFEYPGLYGVKDDGQPLTDVRMEEEEVEHNVVEGTSICRAFSTGGKFKVRQHRASTEEGNSFVLTRIHHVAHEPLSYETGQAAAGGGYENDFTAIPDDVNFRPARLTPKPRVQGVQTAVVTGPSGEEIFPDKYGRVKVQFHWDRYGKKDENSSCWVRVSQIHAGKGFGGIDIPRIGEEVIVSFPDGDPDHPLITGRVYHAENMPPFGLPGAMNISGMKSNSTKGGGGYNEYVFDDTKGNELIREHGQFDKDSTIENDLREHVLHDRSRDVTNNETVVIGNDRTDSVGNNETLSVGSNRTRTVGKNELVTVTLTRTHNVGVNEMINVGGAQEVTVGGLRAVTVGLAQAHTVGKSQTTTIGTNMSESIGDNRTEEVGKNRSSTISENDTLSVGKNLTITAGEQISLTTGKASIVMKKDGTITISGKDITINGSGKITETAKKDMILKGKKILQN